MIVADQAPAPVTSPCEQPALVCPNLTMPKARRLRARRTPNGRVLLEMDNYLVNEGPGRLTMRGHRSSRHLMDAVQLIDRSDGTKVAHHTGGRLTWKYVDEARGSFWKFQNAARFELWRMDAGGRRTSIEATSPKLDYCLRDLFRWYDGDIVRKRPFYPACSQDFGAETDTMGVSIGWADGYPHTYPQNWIEVTGLRGCFLIVQRADPLNHILELDESDNTSNRVVRLPYRKGKPQRCPAYSGLGVAGSG